MKNPSDSKGSMLKIVFTNEAIGQNEITCMNIIKLGGHIPKMFSECQIKRTEAK
jgi:hypothetical protein